MYPTVSYNSTLIESDQFTITVLRTHSTLLVKINTDDTTVYGNIYHNQDVRILTADHFAYLALTFQWGKKLAYNFQYF